MAGDPLDQVLRLVAEGKLTAEEAAPILAALDERAGSGAGPGPAPLRPGARPGRPPAPMPGNGAPRRSRPSGSRCVSTAAQVVNLRLPLAVGRLALDRIPGLSGEQVDSVREALSSGMRGPILEVNEDDGESTVRIVVE